MPNFSTSRAPRARYAALILLALPLLAGCSAAGGAHASEAASPSSHSVSSGSGSAADRQPCDYLSAADASSIFGVTITSSEAGGACSYTDGQNVAFATTVNTITGASDPDWKNEVESLDGTKLSGVGDEAYGGSSAVEEKIIVRQGHSLIEVADADGSDSTTYPNSIAVAKAIIAQLG